MIICIPTLKRLNYQLTWDAIPENWRYRTFLVCPEDEASFHESKARNIMPCPLNGKTNLAEVRQWLINNYPDDKMLMMDDDLMFAKFREDSPKLDRIEKNPVEMSNMLNKLEEMLDTYCAVGLAFRSGANRLWPSVIKENTRIHTVLGFNTGVFHKHNIKFNEPGCELMEDIHALVSLLKLGYKNACLCSYTHDQKSSNTAGGCSLYRNEQGMHDVSHKMQELHGPFVKAVQKETNGRWAGMSNKRWDVNVQWKKAYEYGRSKS